MTTPVTAEALEDLEQRLGEYADERQRSGSVGLLSKADSNKLATSGLGYVNHGATAGMARPTGWAAVLWLGSVEPSNASTTTSGSTRPDG